MDQQISRAADGPTLNQTKPIYQTDHDLMYQVNIPHRCWLRHVILASHSQYTDYRSVTVNTAQTVL